MLRRVREHAAPTAADVQEQLTRRETQLAARVFKLRLLRVSRLPSPVLK